MNKLLIEDAEKLLSNVDIKELENKVILITGASGLLGINLISLLKVSNIDFKCIASFNSTPEDWFIEIINNDKRFACIQHDLTKNLCNYNDLEYLEKNIDIIFHFATYGQPNKMFSKHISQDILDTQLRTINLNTYVVVNLFKMLKPKGKFIFMSSSELYNGLDTDHTYKESEIGTTTTEHDRACYIESKRCGEAICSVYRKMGYDVKVIRLCLAYGIGLKVTDRRAMSSFIFEGLTSDNIALLDSGSAIRTYCYISDVLEMMLNIMFKGNEFIYNIGGTEVVTIKEMAEKIGSILNVEVIVPVEENPICGATNSIALDISRYLNELDSDKKFILMDEGLKRVIEWWKFLLEVNNVE